VKYEHKLMRSHLIKILETNVIEHFPQDKQYSVTQKVLPLAVINAREAEVIRICQHETEQQKLNRLGKCLNIYHTKKELYKIQSTLQSTTKKIQLSQNVSKEINNKIQTEQSNENKCSQKKDEHLYLENLQYIQNILNEIIQVSGNNTRTEQNNENKYFQNKNLYSKNLSGDTVVSQVSSISSDIRRLRRYRVSLREPARCEHLTFSDLNND